MKYQNVNPLEKLKPGEPYFFIRAQDRFALPVIQAYASISDQHQSCHEIIQRFEEWQKAHPELVKTPD